MELIVIIIFFIITVFGLLSVLYQNHIRLSKLRDAFNKLNLNFQELDEQAKLIVKTDLELNKAQQELDKRLMGLDALQKISRLISTTLDENEIFHRLNQPLMTELGFEKYLLLTYDQNTRLQVNMNFGFTAPETEHVVGQLNEKKELIEEIKEEGMLSSVRLPADSQAVWPELFQAKHFVITPILAQKDLRGIFFAGSQSDAFSFTEGDEELIQILSDQIGQSVENARLFEQVYNSRQILEQKVQERTKQLSTVLEEVQQISKNKSEFISAVSHELRTPLTSIKGYASILMAGKVGEIPVQVKERLGKINKHSDNLVKLINDLLDISRIESGRVEMNIHKASLAPVIENVSDLLAPQLKEKQIHFETEISPGLPEVFIDTSQIERVFINLIGNAVKFTPKDGLIKITAEYDDQQIRVAVSDTGIGIKKEDIEKLFNEFYRVENEINQNVKGSGLGLALVHKIIEAHQGHIHITSTLHEGSTFTFTLPINPEDQGPGRK